MDEAYAHGGEQEALKRLAGKRSLNAIRHKRTERKLHVQPLDAVTTTEYAQQMGTNVTQVFKRIKKGSLKAFKRSGRWYIPLETLVKDMQVKRLPWPSVDSINAAKRIGVDESSIQRACVSGYIDAVKVGRFWHIRKDHIDYAALLMRRKGWVKMQWPKLRAMLDADTEYKTLKRIA